MSISDEDEHLAWWERTWGEREEAICELFGGASHPPGSPEDNVIILGSRLRLRRPGACVLVFRPCGPDRRRGLRARDTWMYVTHGLTQPSGPEQVEEWRAEGRRESGSGFELGIEVMEPAPWVPQTLGLVMELATEVSLGVGHRMMFGLHRRGDHLEPFLGRAADLGFERAVPPVGLLLWRHLAVDTRLVTETGTSFVLTLTTITHDEWCFAQETSNAHLQLLLCRAGVEQVSRPTRPSVLGDASGRAAAERIRSLDEDAVTAEINARQ